ncbi:MAG: DUF4340 domain-containing protein [Xenococcus sp. (in: cyanobacteria)]
MKLKKTTWILMIIAFVLSGWVTLYELPRQRQKANNITQQKIFNIEENQIRKITINKPDMILEFVAIADQANSWSMIKPEETPADDAVMAFLTDLLATGTSDRVITLDHNSLAEYGLEEAIATISFTTTDEQNYKIILGKSTIGDRFIYAQVFSNTAIDNNIVLVSKNWQYAIDRDLQEWKSQLN